MAALLKRSLQVLGSRRLRFWLRLTSVALILFGPIAFAAWDLHAAPVRGLDATTSRAEAEYRSRRNPIVDRLLPEGVGGTRFSTRLDGNLGIAFVNVAAIGLSPEVVQAPWPEATELHERAHLVHAFLPHEVARVLARLPDPAPDELAAEDPGQHFAEMAGKAWEIVAPPDGFCLQDTPVDRLRETESRVPGTAGFVAWYLRQLPAFADREGLADLANDLLAPQRMEWEALWSALDARRRDAPRFQPWPARSVRETIEQRRLEARLSGRWIDRLVDIALAPSLIVLAAAGR